MSGRRPKKSVPDIVDMHHSYPNIFTPPRVTESQMVFDSFLSSRMSWSEGSPRGDGWVITDSELVIIFDFGITNEFLNVIGFQSIIYSC